MAKWAENNNGFKISDMNKSDDVLHIFFRSYGDDDYIHSAAPIPENLDSYNGNPQALMKIAVRREFEEGGAYYNEQDSLKDRAEQADDLIYDNIEHGYDLLTAFVAPKDFQFIM